jgi:predicted dehydrogenase
MVVYDDIEPSEKVKFDDKGAVLDNEGEEKYKLLAGYRYGDMWAPSLDTAEAVFTEVGHFVDCVRDGYRPLTDGTAGFRVVQILESAEQSLRNRGALVDLPG